MTFDFTCPSCGELVAVAEEHRGWTMRCPQCQSQFQAGSAPVASAPPPPAPHWQSRKIETREVDEDNDLDALPFATVAVDRELAFRAVSAPSWFLEITAWLHMVALGGLAALMVLGVLDAQQNGGMGQDDELGLVFFIIMAIFGLGYFGAMAYGARQMRSLNNYNWALAGGILGLLGLFGCFCGVLTIAAGCWALVVINRPEVRRAFEYPG